METQIIAVHVGSPVLGVVPEFFPAGNWVGARLLHKLLSLALSQGGLMVENSAGMAGELNDCVFMAAVNDVDKAVEVIKGQICPWIPCQIAICEASGNRCVYPSPDIRMGWLLDTDRHELASVQMRQSFEAKLKLIQGNSW